MHFQSFGSIINYYVIAENETKLFKKTAGFLKRKSCEKS